MTQHSIASVFKLLDKLPSTNTSESLYDSASLSGRIRRANLDKYFHYMSKLHPKFMLVGEAPGYRGTSVTGIPFMSCAEAFAIPGHLSNSSIGDGFNLPNRPQFSTELTSRAMWQAISEICPNNPPLLWAIYPNHPHLPDDTTTNRAPTPDECQQGVELVNALINVYEHPTVIALGRKAEATLIRNGIAAEYIRHPSRGGLAAFRSGLEALHKCEPTKFEY